MSAEDDGFNKKRVRAEIEEHLRALKPAEFARIKDISVLLADEMAEGEEPGNAMLFCGSDGNVIVKGYHFPRSVLNGDGPEIIPSANPLVILGAYSDEFIQGRSDDIKSDFPYDEGSRNMAWESFLNNCALELAMAARNTENNEIEKFLEDL